MNNISELKGFIIAVYVDQNNDLYFQLLDQIMHLIAIGDCCANAYINHIDGSEVLFNANIKSIEDLKFYSGLDEEQIDDADDSYMDIWGHRIITDKGICTIDCRTSHNGYYGGSLEIYKIDLIPKTAKLLTDF